MNDCKDIAVTVDICLSASHSGSKLPQPVLKLQRRHLTPPQPHSHADFHCITTAVVEVVSCVDANANPGCHTNSTYCPLYRRRTKNIISSRKRRCHCVHQCEPCLNIQFLPCTREDLFDVVENSPHESSI